MASSPVAGARLTDRDIQGRQPVPPPAQRRLRHRQRHGGGLPGAAAPGREAGPWKEGDQRSGSAGLVAEVQVVAVGGVEVDRLLHQPQAQHLAVEVDVALRVRGDRRDVVQTRR
ncbi:hypothetical protein M4D79_20185 [Mycolicibacterium novocastrense]|nr:hypothetical protein M4D79_20185 [Mycolicibacterium novocastrense]